MKKLLVLILVLAVVPPQASTGAAQDEPGPFRYLPTPVTKQDRARLESEAAQELLASSDVRAIYVSCAQSPEWPGALMVSIISRNERDLPLRQASLRYPSGQSAELARISEVSQGEADRAVPGLQVARAHWQHVFFWAPDAGLDPDQVLNLRLGSGEQVEGRACPPEASDRAPASLEEWLPADERRQILTRFYPGFSFFPTRVRISQGVSQGLLVHRVAPNYPSSARRSGLEGAVVLKAVIGTKGEIARLDLVSGHPTLAEAAMEAVRQWRYKPFFVQGNPVEVETQITVNFRLGK